jgi:hypothetical protein
MGEGQDKDDNSWAYWREQVDYLDYTLIGKRGIRSGRLCRPHIAHDHDCPGKDWVRLFKKRWRHRVKVRRPSITSRPRSVRKIGVTS